MAVCAVCGQENPDIARFCLACGSPLAEEAALPPEEERKVVTALFTDIVGSTARAESLDPEDVRARLAPYYARVRKELESFGGTVEKFIGDAVVALFGAPAAHENDPERAVRAALAIKAAVAELNDEDEWFDLHIRTAVHTGEALVVPAARATEGEGMAAGDVMNTAARLQSKAPEDGVVVGEATYRATAELFEYLESEPVEAKGKSKPVPAWILVGEKAVRHRPSVRARFVGREQERAQLLGAWEHVRAERRPRFSTVLGPPGIGKTRLIHALAEAVEGSGAVHWGRCLPYGEGMTYWPVIEIAKSAAGILQSDDPATVSAKLGALLDGLPTDDADEVRTMAAALANLIGVPTTPRGTYSAGEISQAELHWGIRRTLQLLAAKGPLVLVFEDLHWAELTLLDFLVSLEDVHGDAAYLVLGSARPELADDSPAILAPTSTRSVIELEALSERESEALAADLLGGEGLDDGPAAALLHNAAGNPLFLEETARLLHESRLLAGDSDLGDLPVPRSLQALIGSRIDGLATRDKRVAQHASVVGHIFWLGAVMHLHGASGDLSGSLETLERRDFVYENEESSVAGDLEYAFKHILIRDVAYERLPKGRRAQLHVAFADWLGNLPAAEDEFVEILAYHFETACSLARSIARSPVEPPVLQAVDALQRSAQKAERHEGLREADRFYARALDLVGDGHPPLAVELKVRRGAILAALGDLRWADELLGEAADAAAELGRADLRCVALVELGDIDQRQGRAGEARRHLAEAHELAGQVGDPALETRAVFVLAALRADFDGEFDTAVEELRWAVGVADEIGDRALAAEGHLRAAALLRNLGRFAEAEEELERCLVIAREMGSHRVEAEATSWLGIVKYYRGELDEAERLGLQAREWLERTCDSYFQVQNLVSGLAVYALARGDTRRAESWLREALPTALEIGGWLVVETYRFLAETLLREGRVEDARRLANFAGINLPEEDAYARAAVLLAEAAVATAEGERQEATGSYLEALRLLDELHMPVDGAEAHLAFARALARFGDLDGARMELARAREVFSGLEADGALAAIERELAGNAEEAGDPGLLLRALASESSPS